MNPKSIAIAAALMLTTGTAIAQANTTGSTSAGINFEQVKQLVLDRIDQRRSCVSKATNFSELKSCKPEHGNRLGGA